MHDPRHCGLDGARTIFEMTSASLQDESSQLQNGGKDVIIAPDATRWFEIRILQRAGKIREVEGMTMAAQRATHRIRN